MTDTLSHHGVLGMHWGKRQGSSESSTSPDHKNAHSLKGKKLSEMSNDELKTLSTRLELEKKFKEAAKQDMHPAKKVVGEILANAGKQTAATYLAKYMGKGVEAVIKVFHP